MNRNYNIFIRKLFPLVSLFCVFVYGSSGQATIRISTANCTISSNEVQMDILLTNSGTVDLRWNGCVIRMNIPATLIPAGKQTYTLNYLGGSDFPLSFPAAGNNSAGAIFNQVTNVLSWVSTSGMSYNNRTCGAPLISAGQTKHIGRFSFKITSSEFPKDAVVDFKWHPTTSCILYQDCAPNTIGFGTSENRILTNPCTLTVPRK